MKIQLANDIMRAHRKIGKKGQFKNEKFKNKMKLIVLMEIKVQLLINL